MKSMRILLILLGIILVSNAEVKAQTFREYFIDTTDQAYDMSNFLATRMGLMPYPVLITEPAVGYGAGLGLIFFHRSKEERESGNLRKLPPSLTMLAGLYTENGTWAGLVGHQGSYRRDHIRYFGILGYINVNSTFYGTKWIFQDKPIDFNLNGFLMYNELLFRIKKTDIFIGGSYSFFGSQAKFYPPAYNRPWLEDILPELNEIKADVNNAGLNGIIEFDTRNNIFTPTSGLYTLLKGGYYGKELGGDRNYYNLDLRSHYYAPVVSNKLFSGFRFKGNYRWGDVPFYRIPFIQLRGIPAMRYQGNVTMVLETEWRWNFWRRWSVLAFAGSGWAANDFNTLQFDQEHVGYGTGLRYFIAREYGVHMGLDFAWGPETFAWYVTFGSAWPR